ncbi:Rabconnectin [Fasciola gigantica]|uniref:Rabconnectin n=1 Tax=Fasciola gigantica TaxID=46835 RepID=A0A504YC02_FASGI|nr:Rabconnectin [Fasciola gigantica]
MNVTSVPATTITVNPTGAYRFGTDASNSVGFGTASSFGLEQNGANLALWDSLLPPHRCGVIRVTDPELECPCTAVAHCIWRLSEPELIASFSGNIHHQGRGAAAAVAAAALFRGNQSAAIIAATHPGVAQIRLLPGVTGASLLHQGKYTVPVVNDYTPSGLSYEQHEREKHSLLSSCTACRFLSCGADGGLRLRSFVVRPKPFTVA